MLRGFLKIACIGKGINRAVGAAVTFLFTHHLVKKHETNRCSFKY